MPWKASIVQYSIVTVTFTGKSTPIFSLFALKCKKYIVSLCHCVLMVSFISPPFFQIYRLIHGGQLLNGLAGPTIMSAGPLLSTTWFAPDQRATATAIASLIGYLGSACAFLIGPLAVPAPNDTEKLGSTIYWNQNHIGDRIQFVLYAGTVLSADNPATALILNKY